MGCGVKKSGFWKEIFIIHITSDEALISRMYIECLQIIKKKADSPVSEE